MWQSGYSPAIDDLLVEGQLNPLGPGTPNEALRARLAALTVETMFAPGAVRDREMAGCCLAGMWLYHNFIDEAHAICQDIATASGSYWHGIVHRREPDFDNARYWFRRVGRHEIFVPLHQAVLQFAGSHKSDQAASFLTRRLWDPIAFVDWCEEVEAGRSAGELLCRQIQDREWQLLFDYCYCEADGSG